MTDSDEPVFETPVKFTDRPDAKEGNKAMTPEGEIGEIGFNNHCELGVVIDGEWQDYDCCELMIPELLSQREDGGE